MLAEEQTRTLLLILFALLLRWCVSQHPHSGQSQRTGPMYGDYEAQRHWMEITYNLPVEEWYFNTSNNDLLYWGLDYPPLTAYHSLLCGYVAAVYEPASVSLNSSRGYESYTHKLFMRYTVFIADILIYIPAFIYFLKGTYKFYENKKDKAVHRLWKENGISKTAWLTVFLLYPGLILIDYGHFQYNAVSLGLMIVAVAALVRKKEVMGAIFFCLALNYKQMELYHSIPFFCYLLGLCVNRNNSSGMTLNVKKLLKIGLTVIISFFIIWFPFMQNYESIFQVVHRLFPFARGVYEDKVANFWCSLSVFLKLHNFLTNVEMAKLCLVTTLISVVPNAFNLFVHPNLHNFFLSLINCSLGFFLFSYQVHEKTILLVAVPVLLYFPLAPFECLWFLFVSVFSMLPLLVKDGLYIAYMALSILYVAACKLFLETSEDYYVKDFTKTKDSVSWTFGNYSNLPTLENNSIPIVYIVKRKNSNKDSVDNRPRKDIWKDYYYIIRRWLFIISMLGCVVLSIACMTITPPSKYPDLFPVLISVYSCIHFIAFLLFFNVKQLMMS